jgi:hypothetical protein
MINAREAREMALKLVAEPDDAAIARQSAEDVYQSLKGCLEFPAV